MKKILFILTLSLLCAGMSWAQNVIFVKSGVTDGDIITVGSETGAAYTTLKEAVAHATTGDIVKLTEDVTEEGTVTHPYGAKCCVVHDGITIDGDGHSLTVTGISGGYTCAIYTKGGTIRNLTVTGGFRVIFSGGSTSDINIDHCVIDAGSTGAYTFNSDAAGPYALNITNTTLKGWTSYTTGYTSSTIANNTFDKCSYLNYGYYRPYIPTVVQSCNFPSSDFWVDASTETRPDGGGHGNILFNECTYLGAPLTQNNVEQLLDQDWSTPVTHNYAVPTEPMTRNNDGEITGGVFSGTVSFLETLLAYGYEAYPLGTDPETYRVTPVYYIHYNANGGSGTMEDSYVPREAPNNVFTVPACTFTHASFSFSKWNTKAYGNGTDLAENDQMTLTSDTTLYAIWDCEAMIGTTCYATLQEAVAAASIGDTVRLLKDVVVEGVNYEAAGGKCSVVIDRIVLDGQGHKLTGSNTNNVIYTKGGTIMNLTIRRTPIGGKGIFMRGYNAPSNLNADVIIDNCDIDDVTYGFHLDGDVPQPYTFIVKNSTIKGWSSYSPVFNSSVSVTDCSFGKGTSGYAVFRPYSEVVIQGTSFSSEFKVDPIIAPSILFNNCDLAGTPLTSANIDNLLEDQATDQAVSQEDPRSHAVVVNGGYSTNDNDEITGGIYGGNPEVLSTMIASGYAAFPLNTDPQTYQVDPAYFIHFNAAGGTGTHGDSIVRRTSPTFTVPANTEFTYGSYGFLNWNSKPYGAGTDIAVGSTMTLSSDTTLYAEWNIDFVAKIGSTTYPTFQAAIDDATTNMTGDVTIELMKNIKEWVLIVQKSGLNLTIDGHSTTLTGQIIIDGEARHCGTETLEIKDLNFAYEADAFATYTNSTTLTNGFVVTPTNKGPADAPYKTSRNYIYSHNITVKDCNFDGAGSTEIYAFKGAWGSNPRNIKLDNCTAKNVFGFAFFAGVSHCDAVGTTGIEITDCEATENIQQALYISGGGSSTHNITGNTFTAEDFALYIDNAVNNPTYNLSGNTMTADTVFKLKLNDNGAGGAVASTTNINIDGGTYIGDVVDYDPETHLNISGGIYSEDVSGEPCEEGYAAFANGTTPETWTVTKAWFLRYNANGGTGTTMDSVFVKQSDDAAGRTVTVADCGYTKDTYAFAEWNTKADGTGTSVAPGDQFTLTQDTVLYAQWARVKNVTQDILYDNLQTAINAATAGDSLVVLTDLNINALPSKSVSIEILKSLVINGGKHTITSTATRGLWVNASNVNLTLRNFYLDCTNTTAEGVRGVQLNGMDGSVFSNNTLLMDSCRVTTAGKYGKSYAMNLTCYGHDFTVTVKNSYIKGWAAVNNFASDIHFVFENDTLHGVNQLSTSSWDNYSTINLDGAAIAGCTGYSAENCVVDIVNTVVIAEEQGTCKQYWGAIKYSASNVQINVDCDSKLIDIAENDISEKLLIVHSGDYPCENSSITLPLATDAQKSALMLQGYALTDVTGSCDRTKVGFNVGYTYNNGNDFMYTDFSYPFNTLMLSAEDVIELLEDVVMTDTLEVDVNGNVNIEFSGHSITRGDNVIMIAEGSTVTTDQQALSLFSSPSGYVTETDNGDGTYTYGYANVYNATQDKGYYGLQTAINAADAGDSLVILTDLALTYTIAIPKDLTINGNKHVITTTKDRGLWFDAENVTLKLKNFYFDGTGMDTYYQATRGIRAIQVDQNNVTLNMDSCRIYNVQEYALYAFRDVENAKVTVKNSYINGGLSALRSYASSSEFSFINDSLISTSPCDPVDYTTIYLDGNNEPTLSQNNNITIQNCVIISNPEVGCDPQWLGIAFAAAHNQVTVDAATKIIDGDENDITSEMNFWLGGGKNYVTIPLSDEQIEWVEDNDYTVTATSDGSIVSAPVYWHRNSTAAPIMGDFTWMFIDFNSPFKLNALLSGDTLDLDDNITMKQNDTTDINGDFKLNFKTYNITQGSYSIVLGDNATCTTDKQALELFSSLTGSNITETDNNDGTWTYSVTPYFWVTYNPNSGTGTIDNQVKPNGTPITLSDGTDGAGTYLFTKPDSTLYRWNTTPDEAAGSTNYALGAEYTDNANLDLFAVWRLNLDMEMDSTDVVCYGENNGTDTVKIIGGDTPFQLVLSSTVLAENDTVKNLMDRTYIYKNLKPGKYTVQLTDVLTKDTIKGTFTIAQPDTLIVESMTVPVKPCPLMGTGVYNVSMTTTGGNGGNHFVWGEAAVDVDAMESTVISGADDRDSTYTVAVKVTDKKGCVATDTTTFTVSPVIADDGTVHSNSKLTIDTIKQGIMSGCDTVLRNFGTPVFTSTHPEINEGILDTIYNDIPTSYPDSVFSLGENVVIWTAVDTCGHMITGEQIIIIYHYPCPDVEMDGYTYHSVRLACDCWTDENLKTTKYSDGRAVNNLMKYESPTHPDAEANFAIYGYLYDWTAALDAESGVTPDADGNVQGICPTGWHLPSDIEFANVAGLNGTNEISDLRYHGYWLDGGGNNSTNFSLLPGGCYNDNTARYENLLGNAYLWSVNSADPNQPKVFWADCHCYMWQVGNPSANMGCSVRCVKD